jgi:aspartate aminotransferase
MSFRLSQLQSHLMSSQFEVEQVPADAIFKLTADYKQDSDPMKINLGVGAYRDNDGKPWTLPVVKKAELRIVQSGLDHEYLPIDGIPSFCLASQKLMLGASSAITESRIASAQTLSGTGAVRLGADFLYLLYPNSDIYISNPTWANHRAIFSNAGFKSIKEYEYWDPKTRGLNLDAVLKCFSQAERKSVVLLHPCAHNPTGVDPTMDQWKLIHEVIRERDLIVFFDSAYQGFASGNLDLDAQAVRYFVEQGTEVLIAQSYAKNFGLYNERCGCLSIVTNSPSVVPKIRSQLCRMIRAQYSNPPAFGARIVDTVLNDPQMYEEW